LDECQRSIGILLCWMFDLFEESKLLNGMEVVSASPSTHGVRTRDVDEMAVNHDAFQEKVLVPLTPTMVLCKTFRCLSTSIMI
jgi:hypothetical protein